MRKDHKTDAKNEVLDLEVNDLIDRKIIENEIIVKKTVKNGKNEILIALKQKRNKKLVMK